MSVLSSTALFDDKIKRTLSAVAIMFAAVVLISGQQRHSNVSKDSKLEKHIATLGREYSRAIQRNDVVAIEKFLADDYLLADEEGKIYTKQQDLATYPNRAASVRIDTVEYIEQTVRVITRDVAIDHATIRFIGKHGEKPFDITERCTTMWAKRDGHWKIVADHFSYVKSKAAQ